MIDVSVLAVKPHPDQATNNPGTWAVQLHVTYKGRSRLFWRWYTVRQTDANGAYVTPPNEPPPTRDEILAEFWELTFGELNGFDFEREEAAT